MPVIGINVKTLCRLIGREIPADELVELISMIGSDIESFDSERINVEFFPNRPDLYSQEGVARALKSFLGMEKGLKKYSLLHPSSTLFIDKSVKKVRPFAVAAEINDVAFDDELISSLMEIQEDLHWALGRDRKKVAIGVHDAARISPPYYYKAVEPESMSFVPLGFSEALNLKEILEKHPKGVEYASIIKDSKKYPIILDSQGNVLSMPPIINGELTKVTLQTKNLFIEMTGTSMEALDKALNMLCTSFAERGAKIRQCKVVYDGREIITPDFTPEKMKIKPSRVNSILGLNLSIAEMQLCLEKMGYGTELEDNKIAVSIPSYRNDILHEIDIAEDVAIAHGYANFPRSLPEIASIGERENIANLESDARKCMLGYGFTEALTLMLTSEKRNFDSMKLPRSPCASVKNPISEEHTIIRTHLLPNLLEVLEINKTSELPIKIFEVGCTINEKLEEELKLCACIMSSKTDFSEIKSIFIGVADDMGIKGKVEELWHKSFISGRCAGLKKEGKITAYFGEIAPEVLENFEIEYPVTAMEILLR